MLSFSLLYTKLLDRNYAIAAHVLRDPEQTINDVVLHVYPGLTDTHGTVFILPVSEYIQSSHQPDGLYLLIPDRKDMEGYIPHVNNWVMLTAENDVMAVMQFAKNRLLKSQRLDAATLKLSQSLLKEDSVEALLRIGAAELGAPIFCSDNSTKVLFWSDRDQFLSIMDDELVRSITTYGFVTADLYDKYNYSTYLPYIAESDIAFIRLSSYPQKRDRIIAKLVINGMYFGWLVAVRAGDPFTDADCEIMDVISRMVTMELEKQRTSLPYGFRENLLMELMSNQISDHDEFWDRARCFNWNASDNYRLLIMDFKHHKSLRDEDRIALSMKKHLSMLFPDVNIISLRNKLCMLLETDQLEVTISQLEPFARYYDLEVCISTCFHDIVDLPAQFEAVADLLSFGRFIKPGDSIFYYDDLAQYHLISRMCDLSSEQERYSREYRLLKKYDEAHDTDYIATIRVYLKSLNVLSASRQLHIHRNTMNYRLQKIEEIIGTSLDTDDVIYRLWLSILLDNLSRHKRRIDEPEIQEE